MIEIFLVFNQDPQLKSPLEQLTEIWEDKLKADIRGKNAGNASKEPTSLDLCDEQIDRVADAFVVMLKSGTCISVLRKFDVDIGRAVDDYRKDCKPSELAAVLTKRLGARSQSGTWRAIKELASHSAYSTSELSIPADAGLIRQSWQACFRPGQV